MSNHSDAVEDIKKAKQALEGKGFTYESVKNAGLPDPKKHLYISLAKSFVRIVAGVALFLVDVEPATTISFIKTAGALLVAAEVLGIFEELV
jgi:hypothetical protein